MADQATQEEQQEEKQSERETQLRTSHAISGFAMALIGALSFLAAVAYIAKEGGPPSTPVAPATAQAAEVNVAMHDPGCHWFQTSQGLQKDVTVTGTANLRNSDEAAIVVKAPSGQQRVPVGGDVQLPAGNYTITMVGQAPDDNTLHLTVT